MYNNMKLRVLEICRQKKITQKDLAAMISMTPVGLSRAINRNPTKITLEKIADALSVPISELFEQPVKDVINCPHCGGRIKLCKDDA